MDTYIPQESRPNGRDEFSRSMSDRESEETYRRRPSGAPHDRRMPRQRNRSRSPLNIDRYQPDGRSGRDDYYGAPRGRDDRRRGSPTGGPVSIDRYVPGQDVTSQPALVNPVVDPFKLDYQVGFSYFAEWWRQDKSINEERERQRTGARRPPDRLKGEREVREERDKEKLQIQSAYDIYKEELQSRMARSFVRAHKNDEWFKERYVAEIRDSWRQRLFKFRQENYSQWENQFDEGSFDNFTLEGIYKNDSNGEGGVVEKEEGETVATAEVLGVADLVPSKGGEIRDESGSQPTLLIKTISPTVSRQKLEDFCKEHLGESDGGLKWLSLSDPNPSKRYHRIGWVMLHPGKEDSAAPMETDDGKMKTDGDEDQDNKTENVEVKVLSTAARAQEAINSKTIHDETRGDFTCHVGIHNPPLQVRRKALWDLFSAPERINKDHELAMRIVKKFDQEAGGGFQGLSKVEYRVTELSEAGLLKPVSNGVKPAKPKPERDMDVDGSEDGEDGEMEEDGEDDTVDEEVDDEPMVTRKKELDLLVEYLRRVHNFCFFCVFESDSVHELSRKCPGGHLRRPRASLSSSAKRAAKASAAGEPFPFTGEAADEGEGKVASNGQKAPRNMSKNAIQLQRAFNWVKTYEDKIMQLLEPENADIRKLGGAPFEEAMSSELAKYVKQEDENKFRCKVPECTKLFKAKGFWEKHVEKRHSEWLEDLREESNLVNTYALDPSHIAPSRSDANSNGHFPSSNNQFQSGTPRGFNLNMPMGFAPMMSGMSGPGFSQLIGPHSVTGSGSYGSDDRHRAGPMRRGGYNRGSNRSAPYDRRPSDNRDGRYGQGRTGDVRGGRLGAGGGGGGGAGRWGDGAGVAAVGPREAVQGRSLKSYEDLDAVGGGGGSELNY